MAKAPISLIHPTGSPFSRNAAIALSQAGTLQEVITTVACNPQNSWSQSLNLLPNKIRTRVVAELGRRTWIPPNNTPLRTHPFQELMRVALARTGLSRSLRLGSQGPIDWVYASLDHHVAKHHLQGLRAVYAYEDGAAATFEAAKNQGILCFYDLPIAFYRTSRAIQAEEAQRFPILASALQAVQEPAWKIERKEQEIQLADQIFVPSSFVKGSLLDAGINSDNISIIPFGSPIDYFQPQTKPDPIFRALFVGRVGPRKGVHYLLQAWKELKLSNAELLLIGINEFPEEYLIEFSDNFRYVSCVPHSSLNAYYSSASILVLPSLVEGLALVQLEAMACGIPIITTSNAGGEDIMTDGVEGFIVPIRDREALKKKLEWCYQNPQELAQMGYAARQQAEKLTWELYRQKLASQVQQLLKSY